MSEKKELRPTYMISYNYGTPYGNGFGSMDFMQPANAAGEACTLGPDHLDFIRKHVRENVIKRSDATVIITSVWRYEEDQPSRQ